jgi:hypothetical protein
MTFAAQNAAIAAGMKATADAVAILSGTPAVILFPAAALSGSRRPTLHTKHGSRSRSGLSSDADFGDGSIPRNPCATAPIIYRTP